MKEQITFEYKTQKGENVPQTSKWRWFMAALFYLPSLLLIIVGKIILRIADILLFDTHHFELKIKPKE